MSLRSGYHGQPQYVHTGTRQPSTLSFAKDARVRGLDPIYRQEWQDWYDMNLSQFSMIWRTSPIPTLINPQSCGDDIYDLIKRYNDQVAFIWRSPKMATMRTGPLDRFGYPTTSYPSGYPEFQAVCNASQALWDIDCAVHGVVYDVAGHRIELGERIATARGSSGSALLRVGKLVEILASGKVQVKPDDGDRAVTIASGEFVRVR